jgi:hypothetical protein
VVKKIGVYIIIFILIFCLGGTSVFWYYHNQAGDYKATIADITERNGKLILENIRIIELNNSITERESNQLRRIEEAKKLVEEIEVEFGEAETTISGIIIAIDDLISTIEDL